MIQNLQLPPPLLPPPPQLTGPTSSQDIHSREQATTARVAAVVQQLFDQSRMSLEQLDVQTESLYDRQASTAESVSSTHRWDSWIGAVFAVLGAAAGTAGLFTTEKVAKGLQIGSTATEKLTQVRMSYAQGQRTRLDDARTHHAAVQQRIQQFEQLLRQTQSHSFELVRMLYSSR